MTILEGYFALIDKYPKNEAKLCVARGYPFFVKRSKMTHYLSLAPSEDLLDDYKAKKITWEQYTDRFKDEMRSQKWSMYTLKLLKRLSRAGSVIRLLCYEKPPKNCHRFILLDILNSMEEK